MLYPLNSGHLSGFLEIRGIILFIEILILFPNHMQSLHSIEALMLFGSGIITFIKFVTHQFDVLHQQADDEQLHLKGKELPSAPNMNGTTFQHFHLQKIRLMLQMCNVPTSIPKSQFDITSYKEQTVNKEKDTSIGKETNGNEAF